MNNNEYPEGCPSCHSEKDYVTARNIRSDGEIRDVIESEVDCRKCHFR